MSGIEPHAASPDASVSTPLPGDRRVPIRLDTVSKWYGSVIGVNEMSLTVDSGIVALLGPNGAGKSTLMKLLTGQVRPSLGRVRVFGRSVRSPAARRKLGYCSEVDAFYEEMTGRRFVEAMLRLSGYRAREAKQRAEHALRLVGMTGVGAEGRADKRLRGCSKGMRQRVKLAQAIAHDPELLILDEPLSGLDPVGRQDFCRLFRDLAQSGATLLISSHVLDDVRTFADRLVLMREGRMLTAGTWAQVSRFLDEQPRRIELSCDRLRELLSDLVLWPGLSDVRFEREGHCVLTTADPGGLCDEIARLVREKGYRVDRMLASRQWAGALFSLTK